MMRMQRRCLHPLLFRLATAAALAAVPLSPARASGPDRLIRLLQIVGSVDERVSTGISRGNQRTIKCGLGLSLHVIDHWKEFSDLQREELATLLARPVTQKSRIVGNFQIFYDTTGPHTPSLLDPGNTPIPNSAEAYIDSVGNYFNFAWHYEVDTLGYDAPPFLPGESHYDVFVQEFGINVYGQTQPENQINAAYPPQYDSYIQIDNDFLGFYSQGMAGLKVTAAHELHHAIQLGRYAYWSTDRYFLEITSTWMEDVLHTEVNDYYQYLSNTGYQTSQFSNPGLRFTLDDFSMEYSRAIWGKFIEKRFSREVMHQTWNYIRQSPALTALDQALHDVGSSFRQAFLEWAVWNNNTGLTSDTVKYYAEGRYYPTMLLKPVVQFLPGQRTVNDTIQTMSSAYRPIDVSGAQMTAIISNVNVNISNLGQRFAYILSDAGDGSFRHLSNGVFTRLDVADPSNWSVQESVPAVVADVVVFPNPYILKGPEFLNFHLPLVTTSTASLSIFTSNMDRIYSNTVPVVELRPSEPYLTWDGHDTDGNQASTGVYFYFIMVDDKQYTGKFAVIRP